ncbi:MAG: hypothetical protein ACYCTE_12450 [Acidimicrobiales bacterium]
MTRPRSVVPTPGQLSKSIAFAHEKASPCRIATEVVHLRQSLEAVAAKVRRHEEEIRRLRRAIR